MNAGDKKGAENLREEAWKLHGGGSATGWKDRNVYDEYTRCMYRKGSVAHRTKIRILHRYVRIATAIKFYGPASRERRLFRTR